VHKDNRAQTKTSNSYVINGFLSNRALSFDRTETTVSSSESLPDDSTDHDDDEIDAVVVSDVTPPPPQIIPMTTAIYIRANDLHITNNQHQQQQPKQQQHLYNPAPNTNISNSTDDLFVAINNIQQTTTNSSSPNNNDNSSTPSSPIARTAVHQLYQRGIELVSNEELWTPEKKTGTYIRARHRTATAATTNRPTPPSHNMAVPTSPLPSSALLHTGDKGAAIGSDAVLTWSAVVGSHNCVRSEGVVERDAGWVYDLLIDSTRARAYNRLSLGREDLWVMGTHRERRVLATSGDNGDGGREVVKVVRGRNKPPMMKPVVFHSLMCGRELEGGAGYVVVTRTARLVEEGGDGVSPPSPPSLLSELYTGIMLVLRIEGCNDDRCVLVNASEFTAPVPAMMTKRIGLTGMVTMIQDIRKLGVEEVSSSR